MKTSSTIAAACAALALVSATSAATIVAYDMGSVIAEGQTSPFLNLNASTTAANITASPITNAAGNAFTTSLIFAGNDRVLSVPASRAFVSVASYAEIFTPATTQAYAQFSITVADGFTLAIDGISFQSAIASTNTTTVRAFYLVSESNPANFSATSTVLATDRTAVAQGTLPLQATPTNTTVTANYSVTNGATLSGLQSIGGTQHFRFYVQADDTGRAIAFDDIVISGTVSAIPEPSAFAALAGLAALGFIASRRRRSAR